MTIAFPYDIEQNYIQVLNDYQKKMVYWFF